MEDKYALQGTNFITAEIDKDLESGKCSKIITRFPPEPNGYIHIGHAKSITVNHGLAKRYNGQFNLRFDDTNPLKEDNSYVNSIKNDVKWLEADFGDNLYFASDYFEKMYEYAIQLIKKGKAYVCDLTPDEMRTQRGTLTEAGVESPYRNRAIDENLQLFEDMKNGKFENGLRTLRAKIDMASPNINLRDPVMYRIQNAHHHRQGDKWNIYPTYDWAHGIEDSIEGVTHSICTLEFEDHRPLYNWYLEQIDDIHRPRQIEFAKLNLSYTVLSKRKLIELVETKIVEGWDDPRMPTIAGLRRRGFTADSIRKFCMAIGLAKADSLVEYSYLEHFIRDELNQTAERKMAILDPLKVVITNYPEDKEEMLTAKNHPKDESMGTREIPFSRELYIEREDFMEDAPKKFFRLSPGKEVRFVHAYYITCNDVIKDDEGNIIELHCTYDPETRGGWTPDRKVKGTIHWLSTKHAAKATICLYDNLFSKENPNESDTGDFKDNINPDSVIVKEGFVEPSLLEVSKDDKFQFLRLGFFVADNILYSKKKPVFNRIVGLKDTWAKKKK